MVNHVVVLWDEELEPKWDKDLKPIAEGPWTLDGAFPFAYINTKYIPSKAAAKVVCNLLQSFLVDIQLYYDIAYGNTAQATQALFHVDKMLSIHWKGKNNWSPLAIAAEMGRKDLLSEAALSVYAQKNAARQPSNNAPIKQNFYVEVAYDDDDYVGVTDDDTVTINDCVDVSAIATTDNLRKAEQVIKRLIESVEFDSILRYGTLEEVKTYLEQHPTFNPNDPLHISAHYGAPTPLMVAVSAQKLDLIQLFLADPRVDVNRYDGSHRLTALIHTAFKEKIGNDEAIKLLLKHPLIDVNKPDGIQHPLADCDGGSALQYAIFYDHNNLTAVKLLLQHPKLNLASPKYGDSPLDFDCYEQEDVPPNLTSLEENGFMIFAHVLQGYLDRNTPFPEIKAKDIAEHMTDEFKEVYGWIKTGDRSALQIWLNKKFPEVVKESQERKAADLFALTVFLCDGLLRKKDTPNQSPTRTDRFFTIVAQLPLELQMLVCNRAAGSMATIIGKDKSEPAFDRLTSVSATPCRRDEGVDRSI